MSTNNTPIYSYKNEDWVKCTKCHKKLFKSVERKGSRVEIKCKCGSIESIEV